MIQSLKRFISDILNRNRPNKEIFSKIYLSHHWGGKGEDNFYSGAEIPKVDLCIIRQVLQHLSNENILKILENTKHIPNLLTREHLPTNPDEINGYKVTNGYIRLQNKRTSGVYLDQPPFSKEIREELLKLRLDDRNHSGEIIDAQLLTFWIVNKVS